jgi:hypothetical protein
MKTKKQELKLNKAKKDDEEKIPKEDDRDDDCGDDDCVWNGFAEADEVTNSFPFGNESNRYFLISCPDCGAKQVYQMTRDKLYVIRSEHQC